MFLTMLIALQFIFAQELPELPPLEITEADIVSVVSEYNIIQETNPAFCKQFHGLTDYDEQIIVLCALRDSARRQMTLLHEIVHVLYWRKGIYTGGPYDDAVEVRAQELFKKYFGIKPRAVQTEVIELQLPK